jgi:hypothetical protein
MPVYSNRRGSRPRDARIKRTRRGGSRTEKSSRCRNWKNCTKKRTEACTYPKLRKTGTHTPLAGQKETQAAQRFFRICCTEIHRWASNNLLQKKKKNYRYKYNLCTTKIKTIIHRKGASGFSIPIGDGGNPSPSGEASFRCREATCHSGGSRIRVRDRLRNPVKTALRISGCRIKPGMTAGAVRQKNS